MNDACKNYWKFRPGKNAKGATGPGIYDMDGPSNLCGKENTFARTSSKLYNMKYIHTHTKSNWKT